MLFIIYFLEFIVLYTDGLDIFVKIMSELLEYLLDEYSLQQVFIFLFLINLIGLNK